MLILKHLAIMFTFLSTISLADNPPDLNTLEQSAFIMGPGDQFHLVHNGWKNQVAFMKTVKALDSVVDKIHGVMCSEDQNRSVLIVGAPGELFRYVFARSAGKALKEGCPALWHVEVDTDKIEAGHKFVGEVQEYWNRSILQPSDKKDVILYFSSLPHLVGLGSHEFNENGIETEYVSNIRNGRIRTVAFIDNYNYNSMVNSNKSYVPQAFAQTIALPQLTTAQVDELLQAYLSVVAPQYTLNKKEAAYMYQAVTYYMPNRLEPERM